MPPTAVAEPGQIAGQTDLEDHLNDEGGEAGRLERVAQAKNEQADELLEAGDEEAANIARIEADDAQSQAQELRAEGGATGAMPASAEGLTEVPLDPEEIIVNGIEMEYLDFGGKKPGGASLKLVGGKVALERGHAFPKGTRIKFEGEAVVGKVAGVDTRDPKTGQVTNSEQQHDARIVQLYVSLPDD